MDWLDKAIVLELHGNARVSHQDLARKYDLSFNAIKKRVKTLEEVGAIQEYTVELSLNMLGADNLYAGISTDGTENMKALVDQIGNHLFIRFCYRTGNQRYEAQAVVRGAPEFFELKQFLESLDSVTTVEIHPSMWSMPGAPPQSKSRTRGKKVKFTQTQLRVLRCLSDDVRMPVSDIVKRTGLTGRRIKNSLRDLQEGGGVHFTIRFNWITTRTVALDLLVRFDKRKTTTKDIATWFQEHYPLEFWVLIVWLDEPTVIASLNVADLTKVVEITQTVRATPFAEFVEDRIIPLQSYSSGAYRGPSQTMLEEMFKEAGL